MPKVCSRYAQYMTKMCPSYAWGMREIYPRHIKNVGDESSKLSNLCQISKTSINAWLTNAYLKIIEGDVSICDGICLMNLFQNSEKKLNLNKSQSSTWWSYEVCWGRTRLPLRRSRHIFISFFNLPDFP